MKAIAKPHVSERLACGRRWEDLRGLWHLCRAHERDTGACVCPCGATAAKGHA